MAQERVTKEYIQNLRRLLKQGCPIKEIVTILQSSTTTVIKYKKEIGLPIRQFGFTKQQEVLFKKLRKDDTPNKEIAEKLGISLSTVSK